MKKTHGFTLIELLIVVAIIAILAAIAVPNFLEAQTRSKVAASMGDMRSLVTAIESYQVDWDSYPYYPNYSSHFQNVNFLGSADEQTREYYMGYTSVALTTPLAYLTMLPQDVFVYAKGATDPNNPAYWNKLGLYQYEHDRSPVGPRFHDRVPNGIKYLLIGVGPDGWTAVTTDASDGYGIHNNANEYLQDRPGSLFINGFYDPTNGTVSDGDVVYHGPGMGFEPTRFHTPVEL